MEDFLLVAESREALPWNKEGREPDKELGEEFFLGSSFTLTKQERDESRATQFSNLKKLTPLLAIDNKRPS
jgi:hypothetical protein